ncbi:MAG TPA: ABC transporter permease [Niallia sp.]|nr:ABC transporter permease [Niallia sp.]
MKFTQFLKTRGAIASIFMGIFYAIIMLGIFLSGYSAIPGNIDQLPIAIVNDDAGEYGENIAGQLKENLPFKEVETELTNKKAIKELEKNDLALVIHIPENFSENLQKGETAASIDFTVNEAGPTVVSSTMNSIVNQINNQLSEQFSKQTAQGILLNFNLPEEQAAAMAEKIETAYAGNVVTVNDVPDGMHHNMMPMFLTMAGYVGAMIGAMQLVASFRESRGKASKTRLFIYVQLTALLIAVLSSFVATGVVYLVDAPSGDLFLGIVGHQMLNYMVCFNFTAILIFLVGEGGMVLNLPILLMQTIANGATVARDMMYAPFKWMSHISPMYYSVQAYYADLFGSISSSPYIWSMVTILAITLLINIVIVTFLHKPMPVDKSKAETESGKDTAEITA